MKPLRFLLLLMVCLARGQNPTGTLEGQISDPSGAAVAQAQVTARNPQTGFAATETSERDGSFHFSNLPVGSYELRVSAEGFARFTASDVRVDIDRTVRFPIRLIIESGHSEVNVSGTGATVDLGPTLGDVVSSHEATRPAPQRPQLHATWPAAAGSCAHDRGPCGSRRPACAPTRATR